MDIQITVNGKTARGLMLKNKAKRVALKYGRKVDYWFGSSGHWLSDEELKNLTH